MEQIDGEEDSVLTWGDLYGTRSHLRNSAREDRLNVQKSAEAIVRGAVATACGRAEHEIDICTSRRSGWVMKAEKSERT